MKITVAGVVKEVKDNITISELIAQENVETPEYVTVSVNDEFAKSADFETQQLKDGDNVEFLYFMDSVLRQHYIWQRPESEQSVS